MFNALLTADEAEFVPTLSEGLLLLGKVDILRAAGADSGHLDRSANQKAASRNLKR